MNDCQMFEDQLEDFLEDSLTSQQKDTHLAHLASCDNCKLLLEACEVLEEEFKLSQSPAPVDFTKNVMAKVASASVLQVVSPKRSYKRYFATAALFFLVFGLGFFALNGDLFGQTTIPAEPAPMVAEPMPPVTDAVPDLTQNRSVSPTEEPPAPAQTFEPASQASATDMIEHFPINEDEHIHSFEVDSLDILPISFNPSLLNRLAFTQPWLWEDFVAYLQNGSYSHRFSTEDENRFYVTDPYNPGSYLYGLLTYNEENQQIVRVLGYHFTDGDFSRRVEMRVDDQGAATHYYHVNDMFTSGTPTTSLRSLIEFLARGSVVLH